MRTFTTHTSAMLANFETRKLNGRDYVVADVTMIVPGVLNGSNGPLLYPPDEVGKNVDDWNGMPLVVGHPMDGDRHITARDPDVLERQGIGYVFHARDDGDLCAQAWFDVDKTRKVDNRILERLKANKPLEVSTGLFTENIPEPGTFNGVAYDAVARNYKPDHLAVLPDTVGACSNKDGCGINVNEAPTMNENTFFQRFWNWVTNACKDDTSNDGEFVCSPMEDSVDEPLEDNALVKPGQTALLNYPGDPMHGKMFKVKSVGDTISATSIDDGKTYQYPSKLGGRDTLLAMEANYSKSVLGSYKGYKLVKDDSINMMWVEDANGDTVLENGVTQANWKQMVDKLTGNAKMKQNQRKAIVEYLVGNCDRCKANQKKVSGLSDRDLMKELGRVTQHVFNKTVKNADDDPAAFLKWLQTAPPAIMSAMVEGLKAQMGGAAAAPTAAQDPEDTLVGGEGDDTLQGMEGDDTLQATNGDDTMVAGNGDDTMSMNQWYSRAPIEVREVFDTARRISTNEKNALLERLTSNLRGDERTSMLKMLSRKTINELQSLVTLLPAAQDSDGLDEPPVFNFSGPAPRQRKAQYSANEDDDMIPQHLKPRAS